MKEVRAELVNFFFWPHRPACEILVPQTRIEPRPTAVKAPSPNHWTAREFPISEARVSYPEGRARATVLRQKCA